MVVPAALTPQSAHEHGKEWPFAQRIAFRFACAYLALYLLRTWLLPVPGLIQLRRLDIRVWEAVGRWIATHMLHIASAGTLHPLGGTTTDSTLEYIRILCELAIAVIVTCVWSVIDSKRRAYTTLYQWLRVYVRYTLALIMLNYGLAKLFPSQFPALTLDRLLEQYGESSPMGLLWTFMGYSRPYTVFCGAIELIAGVLLFWQRTTMLGALVAAATMANIVMMNFSYDVPVKQFSLHILLMAVFLLLPDLNRLARIFILNRPADPARLRAPWSSARWNRPAILLKTLVVLGSVWYTTASYMPLIRRPAPPRPPRYGVYEVDGFVLNGEARPPVAADVKRWRRVIINERGAISVQTMDDAMVRFGTKDDPSKKTYELSTTFDGRPKAVLAYNEPAPDHLVLEGAYAGDVVNAHLRKVPTPSFLLLDRGFHWISEAAYNR